MTISSLDFTEIADKMSLEQCIYFLEMYEPFCKEYKKMVPWSKSIYGSEAVHYMRMQKSDFSITKWLHNLSDGKLISNYKEYIKGILEDLSKHGGQVWEFCNKYHGGKAVILCSGPSLDRIDLDKIKADVILAVNKACIGYTADFVIIKEIGDINYKPQKHYIQGLIASRWKYGSIIYKHSCPNSFLLPDNQMNYYFDHNDNTQDIDEEFLYNNKHNANNLIGVSSSTLISAIDFAYKLGVHEVDIIGADFSFDISKQQIYAKRLRVNGGLKNVLEKDYDKHLRWLKDVERQYAIVKEFYVENTRLKHIRRLGIE